MLAQGKLIFVSCSSTTRTMAGIAVDRTLQKPQDYASDGTDAIGFLQFWGNSPALDLVEDLQAAAFGPLAVGTQPGGVSRKDAKDSSAEAAEEAAERAAEEEEGADGDADKAAEEAPAVEDLSSDEPSVGPLPADDGPVNILIAGGADIRHLLKTVSRHRRCVPGRRLRFFLHETHHEVLARHILFLQIINNTRMSVRERMETFLSLYGNSLVREKDSLYASEIAREFVELVTDDSSHPLVNILDLSHLKFKDRDTLQDIFKGWDQAVPFDVEALREQRCRGYYRERYDYRKNLMDWDYQSNIKPVAGIIAWQHYKEFCHTGVAFETRLGSYSTPNRTLASYTEAKDRSKGTTVMVRGFWADIINSPYHGFGTSSHPEDWARLFKISGQMYRQNESDISEFNVTAFVSEMESGEIYHLPPETPEEHVFPYASPLERMQEVEARVEEVKEDAAQVDVAAEAPASEGSGRVRGRRAPKKKKEVSWPPVSDCFENVDVVLLSGNLSEVLRKPKYAGLFHRAFVGSMAVMPLFEEIGLKGSRDPFASNPAARRIRRPPRQEAPDLLGSRQEQSSLASAMAPGALAIFETMKYQAHFDASAKLSFRHRIAQVAHLAGWRALDENRAIPRIEHDMKEKRMRNLEKDSTDFLRFVTATAKGTAPPATDGR
mmetsp:Transcript_147066/g.256623  ORF Transcript_147066/g.256623 Transcript_147066/m.256623 type:complete len:663 (+) Transcript_147066:1-1989(+)